MKPEDDLHEAHECAIQELFDGDPLNASHWFLECAAICIRRAGQDVIAADAAHALQHFMADEAHLCADQDRKVLRSILDFYDSVAPERPKLEVVS